MTELKTLKDFEMFFENPDYEEPFSIDREDVKTAMYPVTHYADVDKLKQEAIKWIKVMKYITDTGSFEIPNLTKEQEKFILETFGQATKGSIELFKTFFNITEEDLK